MSLLRPFRKGEVAPAAATGPGRYGLSRLQNEMENAFQRFWRTWEMDPFSAMADIAPWPAIDETEDDRAITLKVDAPGLEAKDIEIEVADNQLTISGSREEKVDEEKAGFIRHERRVGSFSRTVPLPSYVAADKIEARYDKGILTVTVPKVPGQGPKKVPVQTQATATTTPTT